MRNDFEETRKFASGCLEAAAMKQQLTVSVIIRNRNEGEYLRQVLTALSVQKGPPLEVVVVDNASTDDSVEIAASFGATVVHLRKDEFTYGRGLNIGLHASNGEICVILSAHSLPAGTNFINACVNAFDRPTIAAARCVYAGKSSDMMRWTSPEILDASATLQDIISKGPLASGCAIRRSAWLKIPFDEEVGAAEDKLWASAVIKAGYQILSPCDAFYFYIKAVSPSTSLRYNDRDLRAIFHATGVRFGAADVTPIKALWRASWTIASEVPRAVVSVIARESTRVGLRFAFPRRPRRIVATRTPQYTEGHSAHST